MCDTWWTGVTHIVTPEDGDMVIKRGLKPLRADPDIVQQMLPEQGVMQTNSPSCQPQSHG
eukprot:5453353-Amphidinium_carterae.2